MFFRLTAMKRILTVISVLLLSSSVICAQEADMKVGEFLNTGNWFELEKELSELNEELQENKNNVERYRHLYELSVDKHNKGLKSDVYNKLEFILQLMDSDIVRAKLELAGILKEESADAN